MMVVFVKTFPKSALDSFGPVTPAGLSSRSETRFRINFQISPH